jgi:hypothetical protein
MKKLLTILLVCFATAISAQERWTGTWATAPQATTDGNMPKTSLTGSAARQIVMIKGKKKS